MARDPRQALLMMALNGVVIAVEREDQRWDVRRPDDHPLKAVVIIDVNGEWIEEKTGVKGVGLFQLAQHLRIDFKEVTDAW